MALIKYIGKDTKIHLFIDRVKQFMFIKKEDLIRENL